jgi:hypothetical protein
MVVARFQPPRKRDQIDERGVRLRACSAKREDGFAEGTCSVKLLERVTDSIKA